ncbi:MAG: type II toxin-antitoxin system VapC family toxin [Candidatus Bathyarchaeota archaeon]
MNRYVIDASVATRFVLSEDLYDEAKSIIEGFIESEYNLLAPTLISYEVGNALRTATARKEISEEESGEAYQAFLGLKLDIDNIELDDFLGALALSNRRNISIYDAAYIWLSKKMAAPLVTADARQMEAATGETIVKHLREWIKPV